MVLRGQYAVSRWALGEKSATWVIEEFASRVLAASAATYGLQALKPQTLRQMGSTLVYIGHYIAVARIGE